MDGPGPGDAEVAPHIFMDSFCSRYVDRGEVEWNPHREKLWIRHPYLQGL